MHVHLVLYRSSLQATAILYRSSRAAFSYKIPVYKHSATAFYKSVFLQGALYQRRGQEMQAEKEKGNLSNSHPNLVLKSNYVEAFKIRNNKEQSVTYLTPKHLLVQSRCVLYKERCVTYNFTSSCSSCQLTHAHPVASYAATASVSARSSHHLDCRDCPDGSWSETFCLSCAESEMPR